MKERRSVTLPITVLTLVLIVWGLSVSAPIVRTIEASDRLGCVGPHLTQFLVLMAVGMAAGIAFGAPIRRGAGYAVRAILPNFSDKRQDQALKAAAFVLIVANMVLVFPWLNARVDQFVATHDALRAEIDIVVLLMGSMAGAGWAVLWKRYAWIGLLLSFAMLLMMLANTLTRHAWC